MVNLYFFGSEQCGACREMHSLIKKAKLTLDVNFIYVDALDEDEQDFCDKHNVDELPHIKIIKDDKVIFEKIGVFNPKMIEEAIGRINIFDINDLK